MLNLKLRNLPPVAAWSLFGFVLVVLMFLGFAANLIYSNTLGRRVIEATVLSLTSEYAITDQGQFELYGPSRREWRGLHRQALRKKIRFGCKYELDVSTDLFQDTGLMFGRRFPFLRDVVRGIENSDPNCRELFSGN
jgi:hypothetical protein